MKRGFSTTAIHAGQEPEPVTGAVNVPIFQTSTYAQKGIGEHTGYEYARTQNPTRGALEECIAALEGGARGIAFSSGLAAVDAVMRLLPPGSHVIAGEDMYGGSYRLFSRVLEPLGITFSYVDLRDLDAVRLEVGESTRMIYAETPTNPMMRLCDLAALGEIARAADALLVVDNTFMSPYLQNPLALGASIVLHSSTKYIGGHSDLIGGLVVAASDELGERLKFLQNAAGAVPAPLDCYLALRSLKTLAVRMERHCSNAMAVATYLAGRAEFTNVAYPGLPDFPQRDLAARQMRGSGGMISADLGSLDAAASFCRSVRLFTFAESLGGVESLLCHPVSMTHGSVPPATRARLGITDGLVRFSVGIEDVDDLIGDIEAALAGGRS
jgi:cystathionine beta-lyase/cystathionine gamma-synthase